MKAKVPPETPGITSATPIVAPFNIKLNVSFMNS